MGKFDSILKHLGKENFETPEMIEQALDGIKEDSSNEILDDDNLANIDHLLNLPEFRSSSDDNDPPQDITTPDTPESSSTDTFIDTQEQITYNNNDNNDNNDKEDLVSKYPDIDPEVLKEFEHLSSPPPDINGLLKRFEEKDQDIVEEFMDENKESEDAFEFQNEFEIEDSDNIGFEDNFQETLPSDSNEENSDIADLLSQFSPENKTSDLPKDSSEQPAGINSLLDSIGEDISPSQDDILPEEPQITPSDNKPQDLTADDTDELTALLKEAKEEFPDTLSHEEEKNQTIPIEETVGLGIEPEDDTTAPDLGIEPPDENNENLIEETAFDTPLEAEQSPTDISFDSEETKPSFESDELPDFSLPEENDIEDQSIESNNQELLNQISLDEHKILNIRNRINKIQDPDLRKKVRKILIDGRLSVDLMEQLIAKLLLNESPELLSEFINNAVPGLEEELFDDEIPEQEDFIPETRPKKVIYAEDARKAQEFERELKKISKYALALFGTLILLGLLFYRIIWMPSNADRFYRKGLRAIQSGQFTEAEANFSIAIKKAGPNISWYNKYAQAYEKLKKIKFAEKKYRDALRIDPLNEKIIYNAANLYINNYPYQFDKAIELYSRLRRKHPKNFGIVDLIGTTYIKWGDHSTDPTLKTKYYNEANNIYNDYLVKYPKHLGSYFRQLQIALKFGDKANIMMYDDIILKINKKAININIMTKLAQYYIDHRDMTRAKKVFDRLIGYTQKIVQDQTKNKLPLSDLNTRYPMISEAYYQYARFLSINIDFVKAVNILDLTTRINPRHGRAYNLLGEVYSVQENMPKHIKMAKENFEKSIKYTPNYYKPYANLGHIYYYDKLNIQNKSNPLNNFSSDNSEQNLSRAEYYYETAKARLPKDQKDFLLQYNLAWLYYHNKNFLYAFKEWSSLYIDEPYNPILSYAIANTYFHMGNLSLARIQYDKSIEYYSAIAHRMGYINPELDRHREIYTQLARSYNNRGVINTVLASKAKRSKTKYEQQALLDFYRAKDEANHINMIYNKAEVNIKTILNQSISGRQASFDEAIPSRTSLQNWIDEFKAKMIKNL